MPEETMILRDAARRLARARNQKAKGIESSKLLSLLRSGELKAGFYILGGAVWIEIPLTYWLGIGSSKFRRIGRTDDPKSGAYNIRANEFPDQVARIICNEVGGNEQTSGRSQTNPSRERIATVIAAAARSCEVTVKTKDFSDYLQRHSFKENISTPNVGRRRKEGWRDICSYMAAYMVAYYQEGLTAEHSAEEIVDIAKANGVENLPSADTLKVQVSKMINLLQEKAFKRTK
jgi:hypothetical protein